MLDGEWRSPRTILFKTEDGKERSMNAVNVEVRDGYIPHIFSNSNISLTNHQPIPDGTGSSLNWLTLILHCAVYLIERVWIVSQSQTSPKATAGFSWLRMCSFYSVVSTMLHGGTESQTQPVFPIHHRWWPHIVFLFFFNGLEILLDRTTTCSTPICTASLFLPLSHTHTVTYH